KATLFFIYIFRFVKSIAIHRCVIIGQVFATFISPFKNFSYSMKDSERINPKINLTNKNHKYLTYYNTPMDSN
ncbi:hypothetical protein ACI3PF_20760, partial [Lactococcus lactis]